MERMVNNMFVTKERDVSLFELWPLVFPAILIVSAIVFYVEEEWWPGLVVLSGGLLWAVFSFRIVQPAFAGLIFRFGGRVIISETIRYFRIVDGQEQDIPESEFDDPDFDANAPDIKTEVVSVEYLTRKEGWALIFPILERIVEISLQQHQERINEKKVDESDDVYLSRAESIATAEGINIFPKIFYSYKIVNPGKVFELGGGINEDGDSPFLTEILHNLVISETRGVLAKMEITKILSRETEDKEHRAILISEKIRSEIASTPNFGRLGVEILILRIEDIKFKRDAQDVLDALEEIKKKDLLRQSQVIEADARLQVQRKDSETIVVLADANLKKATAEAAALNAAIVAFAGKKAGEPTTAEDGKNYAQFQIGLVVAKSLETGTKVIIPATEMSKTIAGLINVFDASKP